MDKKQGGGVVAAFFAKPTIAKAAPAYGVTAAWNGVKFLLNARYRRDREKQIREDNGEKD